METNVRLVVSIAKKWRRLVPDEDGFQDLIQIGAEGLSKGIDRFDPTRDYALSTYAHAWIEQAVRRHGFRLRDVIYIPQGAMDRFNMLSKLIAKYERDYGCRPSIAHITGETGLTAGQIAASVVIGQVRLVGSLDAKLVHGDGSSLAELIPAATDEDLAQTDLTQRRIALVEALVAELPPRKQVTLASCLPGSDTLREIAAANGISRSRAGQIRTKAIAKLQQRIAQDPRWRELLAA
jgi:RNA polymerase sigma factor (sigma-70 family)